MEPPRVCFDPDTIIARPWSTTVDECVAMLVSEDERCIGASNRRPIKRGVELVGYIDITEVDPWGEGRRATSGVTQDDTAVVRIAVRRC